MALQNYNWFHQTDEEGTTRGHKIGRGMGQAFATALQNIFGEKTANKENNKQNKTVVPSNAENVVPSNTENLIDEGTDADQTNVVEEAVDNQNQSKVASSLEDSDWYKRFQENNPELANVASTITAPWIGSHPDAEKLKLREGNIPDYIEGKEGFIPDYLEGREGFVPDFIQGNWGSALRSPMTDNIAQALQETIVPGIKEAIPKIKEAAGIAGKQIKETHGNIVDKSTDFLAKITNADWADDYDAGNFDLDAAMRQKRAQEQIEAEDEVSYPKSELTNPDLQGRMDAAEGQELFDRENYAAGETSPSAMQQALDAGTYYEGDTEAAGNEGESLYDEEAEKQAFFQTIDANQMAYYKSMSPGASDEQILEQLWKMKQIGMQLPQVPEMMDFPEQSTDEGVA